MPLTELNQKPGPVLCELAPDLVSALDAWIGFQNLPRPMRAESIEAARRRDDFTRMGLLPFHDDPERAN